MRTIFETLGAAVGWEQETKKVLAEKDKIKIEMIVGQKEAIVNGKVISLGAPSEIINGKTLVPVRFISEALDSNVVWDNENKTVVID